MKTSVRTLATILLTAGDTVVSALATFLLGMAAAILFDPATLGIYQVLFLFALLVQGIVYHRHGAPIVRNASLGSLGFRQMTRRLSRMLRGGSALACMTAAPVAYFASQNSIGVANLILLGIGSASVIVSLPVRDCIRALGHASGHRAVSFIISSVQLLVVGSGILYLFFHRDSATSLFLIFGLGSFLAAMTGWLLLSRINLGCSEPTAEHTGLGPWSFALASVLPQVSLLCAYLVLGAMEDTDTVGYATAASQFGQALFLVMTALNFATIGTSSRGGSVGGLEGKQVARRARFVYEVSSLAGCFLIGTMLVLPASREILASLIPLSFTIPGLSVAFLFGYWCSRVGVPIVNELIGAQRYEVVGRLEQTVALVAIVLSFSVAWVGPFSIPIAVGGAGLVRRILLGIYSARLYRNAT